MYCRRYSTAPLGLVQVCGLSRQQQHKSRFSWQYCSTNVCTAMVRQIANNSAQGAAWQTLVSVMHAARCRTQVLASLQLLNMEGQTPRLGRPAVSPQPSDVRRRTCSSTDGGVVCLV